MSEVQKILDLIIKEWGEPKTAVHRGEEVPFELSCSLSNPNNAMSNSFKLPKSLVEFYQLADGSTLFKDDKFGQWGLNILSLSEAFEKTQDFEAERKRDFQQGDLIIGEFIGDSELLLIRCDSSNSDFENVITVNPIDPREDWSMISIDFEIFLVDYYQSQGDKFWEYE